MVRPTNGYAAMIVARISRELLQRRHRRVRPRASRSDGRSSFESRPDPAARLRTKSDSGSRPNPMVRLATNGASRGIRRIGPDCYQTFAHGSPLLTKRQHCVAGTVGPDLGSSAKRTRAKRGHLMFAEAGGSSDAVSAAYRPKKSTGGRRRHNGCADVAQLVEQLIRNQQVSGSSPLVGSSFAHERRTSDGCSLSIGGVVGGCKRTSTGLDRPLRFCE